MKTLQIGMSASATRGGGLNRYFFNLMRALPQAGIESIGFVAGEPTTGDANATNVHSSAPLDASFFQRLRGMRSSTRRSIDGCDIVVAHFAPYTLPILDIMRDKPLVVHFHGPWASESLLEGDSRLSGFVKKRIESIVYSRSRRFIVLSHAFAEILAHDYGVSRDDIHVIPGGVDCAQFETSETRAALREKIGWPSGRPIVLSVRRLVKAKGLEHLIEAAQNVVRSMPDVLFLIGGTGPLAATLQRSIDDRGLSRNVRLCGFIPEDALPTAYAAADLFVVPTLALEGFGLVVVESLAAGTPALVTPVGGLAEVVTDLDERLVLAGTTPADIAHGILEALDARSAARLPTRAACAAYARRFEWQNIAERVADVYRSAR